MPASRWLKTLPKVEVVLVGPEPLIQVNLLRQLVLPEVKRRLWAVLTQASQWRR